MMDRLGLTSPRGAPQKRYTGAVSTGKTLRFRIPADAAGLRLDQAMAKLAAELSRGEARRLIARGGVFLAGTRVKVAGRTVRAGQVLEVHLSPVAPSTGEPAPAVHIPLLLVTPDLVVVDKPSGVLSAPTPETDQADLLHFLRPTLSASNWK
jgi:23S rRNA pseudouridine1911/1915/1917 synthase